MPHGVIRLTGTVEYADGATETYWFEFPDSFRPSESGNPWLACLLPLAATLHENLEISLPVDEELLEGAAGLLRLWKSWYAGLGVIEVRTEKGCVTQGETAEMSFFSAGVDSYFTALRHPVPCLVTVLGFDMPLRNEAQAMKHRERLHRAASALGASLVPMRTNLRETRWRECHWERLGFGAALATTGLVLERHFHTVRIPSSLDYGRLVAWGSHPLSDNLFSTSTTRIVHDGAFATRIEKILAIQENAVVRQTLHVCFRGQRGDGQDETNCGRCEKCYRTMAVLDIADVLDRFTLFDRRDFHPSRLADVFLESEADLALFDEIRQFAVERGRQDIVAGIDRARHRTRRLKHLRRLHRVPGLWRVAEVFDRRAREKSLT